MKKLIYLNGYLQGKSDDGGCVRIIGETGSVEINLSTDLKGGEWWCVEIRDKVDKSIHVIHINPIGEKNEHFNRTS